VPSSVQYSGWGGGPWGTPTAWGTGYLATSVDGVAGTTALGSETVTADATVTPTGVAAAGSVGSVSVTGDSNTVPTGLSLTGTAGTVSIVEGTGVNVVPTGVVGTASVGDFMIWGEVSDAQTPNWQNLTGF
tara:strand:- start:150 stop:542 length:393 start_codon:yes stop_codon:yes gene_type:complete